MTVLWAICTQIVRAHFKSRIASRDGCYVDAFQSWKGAIEYVSILRCIIDFIVHLFEFFVSHPARRPIYELYIQTVYCIGRDVIVLLTGSNQKPICYLRFSKKNITSVILFSHGHNSAHVTDTGPSLGALAGSEFYGDVKYRFDSVRATAILIADP